MVLNGRVLWTRMNTGVSFTRCLSRLPPCGPGASGLEVRGKTQRRAEAQGNILIFKENTNGIWIDENRIDPPPGREAGIDQQTGRNLPGPAGGARHKENEK